MSNVISSERALQIIALSAVGESLRCISRITGAAKQTVSRYKAKAQLEVTCPCGIPAGHQGWCSWRFKRSGLRQEFIARWGKKMDVSVKVVGLGDEAVKPKLRIQADCTSADEVSALINLIVANSDALFDKAIVFGDEAEDEKELPRLLSRKVA